MLTNAELAILGLVLEQPRHGYAIEGVIDERGMRDWTEVGFSSIYYILRKLEEEGLILGRMEQSTGRGPARKVYSITQAGQRAWRSATVQALSEPGRPNSSFLLGLSGLPGIDVGEALTALDRYRQSLEQRRRGLKERWHELQTDFTEHEHPGGHKQAAPLFLEGMFSYSLRLVEAELDWLDRFVEQLQAQTKAPSPSAGADA